MERLTLEDIGKLAGVSRSTVSRVLNNHPNIRPEVRARVEKVIAETGYQPNSAARSLASKQSRTLGLIMPSVLRSAFTDPYYPRLIQGISAKCNEHDYMIALYLFQTKEEEEISIPRIVSSGMVDGLIITADTIHDPFVPLIQKYNIPFVQIGRPNDGMDKSINYIDVDNLAGAYQATAHLIQQGYQRVAQITTGHNSAGVDRDEGYRRALSDHNIAVKPELIAMADFSEDSGYRAMKTLLPEKPDAVFVQSDTMAIGAMRAIREAGLSVPQDVAVVGFDDLPIATSLDVALTTIRQPIFQTGVLAAEMLIDLVTTSTKLPRHVVFPVELVIRASCGAVS